MSFLPFLWKISILKIQFQHQILHSGFSDKIQRALYIDSGSCLHQISLCVSRLHTADKYFYFQYSKFASIGAILNKFRLFLDMLVYSEILVSPPKTRVPTPEQIFSSRVYKHIQTTNVHACTCPFWESSPGRQSVSRSLRRMILFFTYFLRCKPHFDKENRKHFYNRYYLLILWLKQKSTSIKILWFFNFHFNQAV